MTASATGSAPSAPGPDLNSVVRKVQAIIEALAFSSKPLGLSELARRSGIAKPTVYRLCQELLGWGVVEQVQREFRLGARLYELGNHVPTRRRLRDAALPFMEDLLVATSQTIHLAVLDGRDVLYVDRISGSRSDRAPSAVVGRMPMHCTATGKCLLAFSEEEVVRDYLAEPLEARTAFTVTVPRVLFEQLVRARKEGFAVEREELFLGYASVAAPVVGRDGTVVAALSITSGTRHFDIDRLLPPLRTATRALGRQL